MEMNANDKRLKMMKEEKVSSVLIKLAIPAIVGMLVNAVYNIVDTLFVGRLGTSAVAAVSVAFPLFMIVTALGLTFGIGSASYISRLLGQGNKAEGDRTCSTAFFTSLAVGIIFTIAVLIYLEPILRLFGATETILPYAVDYSKALIIGSVFTMTNMVMNNVLRSEGSGKFSMIALITGAVLNIILDPIFIFSLEMGILGAAVATVISQVASTILLFSCFLRGKSYVKISPKFVTLSTRMYAEIFKIGVPVFITQFLTSVAMAFINGAAGPYGDAAVAAMGITNKVFSLAMFVVFGYCQGFQPLAGFSYGAREFERLKEAIKTSLRWTTIFTCSLGVVFFLFAGTIISGFSNDPEVIGVGIKVLRALSTFLPFFGYQTVYTTLFQALGRGRQAGILSLSRQGLFLIPLVMVLSKLFGLNGLIASQPIADFLTLLLTLVLVTGLKKEFVSDPDIPAFGTEKIVMDKGTA
jgi:putative MATE family efflux protein